MGPTRLRRGYSLEVIFEEDTDFCSHLDSLDSTNRATGSSNQHESNQISLDSLVVEEVEEDEDFFTDGTDSPGPFASFDQVFDIRDMESCLTEWQGPRGKPEGGKDKGDLEIDDGRQSRVSRREILKSTWLLDTDCGEEEEELIVPTLTSSSIKSKRTDSDSDSTLTDDSDIHAYAFADPHDEVMSIASSATLESESLQPVYNPAGENSPSDMDPPPEALTLDVKHVREIFEQREKDRKNSTGSSSPPPTLPPRNAASGLPDSGVNKSGTNKWMKSNPSLSQSSTHLNQLASYDLVDLLVNDRVVIEDSPDIFQTVRSTTNKSTKRFSQEPGHTLRRCKSMSTGIFSPESPTSSRNGESPGSISRQSCILAEEMPAPNIVKNVRNVFERLCSAKSSASSKSDVELDGNRKAPLRSIKSNPTSKIFRSESLRDDNNNNNSDSKKLRDKGKVPVPAPPTSPKKNSNNNGPSNKTRPGSSSTSTTDPSSNSDDDELKYIPAEVLSRIRSHGTTTTYFGGEIVGKTIKNRKLLLPNNPFGGGGGGTLSHSSTPDLHDFNQERMPMGREVMELDLGGSGSIITSESNMPRIVNVFPKSPWSKNPSPNGSIISGRNSPEGCESQDAVTESLQMEGGVEGGKIKDPNNNLMGEKDGIGEERKFSEINEGAWF